MVNLWIFCSAQGFRWGFTIVQTAELLAKEKKVDFLMSKKVRDINWKKSRIMKKKSMCNQLMIHIGRIKLEHLVLSYTVESDFHLELPLLSRTFLKYIDEHSYQAWHQASWRLWYRAGFKDIGNVDSFSCFSHMYMYILHCAWIVKHCVSVHQFTLFVAGGTQIWVGYDAWPVKFRPPAKQK